MFEDPQMDGEQSVALDDPETWLPVAQPDLVVYVDDNGTKRVEISNRHARVRYFDRDGQLHNADGPAVFAFVPQTTVFYWYGRRVTDSELRSLNGGHGISRWEPQDFDEWCEAAGTPPRAPDLVEIWRPADHPY